MDRKKYSSFNMYLAGIGRENKLADEKVNQIIETYFDDMTGYNLIDSAERVTIKRTQAGDVIAATSLKIPNVRFRMGELLYRSVGKGFSIAGAQAQDDLFKTLYFIFGFLRDVFELSKLALIEQDARVLIGIYSLANADNLTLIKQDQLVEFFQNQLTGEQIAASLAELARIWCIELTDHGIRLVESLVIQSIEQAGGLHETG